MKYRIIAVGLVAVVAITSLMANADEYQSKLQSVIRQFDTKAVVVMEDGSYVYHLIGVGPR
jgi:hypothetical protein